MNHYATTAAGLTIEILLDILEQLPSFLERTQDEHAMFDAVRDEIIRRASK